MTNKQINIAIAKARGLTVVSDGISHNLTPCDLETGKYSPEGKGLDFTPDYCNDLNAMHEAEKNVFQSSDLWEKFVFELIETSGGSGKRELDGLCCLVQSTARQRAEAFLKTLNLWKD